MAVERSRVEQHAGSIADSERPAEPRLAAPLPQNVSQVAYANLILFVALAAAGVIFVVVSGIAVVALPFVLGRDGVGRAMITLFLCCVVAVGSGVSLLAARSAARVIRRERRGVASLLAFVRFGALASIVSSGIVWWLSVAFFASANETSLLTRGAYVALGACLAAFVFFVWGMRVLSVFRRAD